MINGVYTVLDFTLVQYEKENSVRLEYSTAYMANVTFKAQIQTQQPLSDY